MKTLLIIIILLQISLFASVKQAQEFFNNKEYKRAMQEAKSSTSEYSNPLLHLIWAESAEALGLENEAMSAYERVVMLDENNVEARLSLMKIYRKTSRDTLAITTGKEIENYQLTPQQRTELELLKGVSIYTVKARASFNIGYDTNINANPGSNVLDDYYGLVGSEGKIATKFSRFSGSVTYVNELGERGGWNIRTAARVYYQNSFSAHKYDMFVGSLETGIGYTGDGYTVYFPFIYDKINYLNMSLMQQYKFEPRFNMTISKKLILNMNLKYAKRDYIKSTFKARDDYALGVGGGFYYLFGKNYTFLNIKYEDFSAQKSGAPRFVDKKIITLSTGFNYNINSWLVSKINYQYRDGRYSDTIGNPFSKGKKGNDNRKRVDKYNQVELKLSHYFSKKYEIFISDKQAQNNSTYLPSKYSKNIFMFGVSINY